MLDENKQFIIEKENKLLLTNKCNKVNKNYYFETSYVETNKCINGIINKGSNKFCKYHDIIKGFVIIKIENSNIIIIVSRNERDLKIQCEYYTKHKNITGIYKFKTDKNCAINDYKLENHVTESKEIIFQNFKFELNHIELSNKTIELKQLNEQKILFDEIPKIHHHFVVQSNHPFINTIFIAIIIFSVIILLFKNVIIKKIKQLFIIEKQNNQTMELQQTDEVPF